MIHPHWWLIGLAFAAGLVVTFVLILRSVKSAAPASAMAAPATAEAVALRPVPSVKDAPTKPVEPLPPARLWPEKKAPAAGKVPAKKVPAGGQAATAPPGVRTRKLPYEPFGPGSARATLDGGGPSGWPVKGRTDTRLYYTPNDPAYDLTVAHVWFKDERSAARALFTPWRKSSGAR